MSFFDDDEYEYDEPTRVNRPAKPRRERTSGGGGGPADPETIQRRRLILFGALAVIALVLVFGIKACSDSRHRNGLNDYNAAVTELVTSSDNEVARPLFELLDGGAQGQDGTASANRLRQIADDNVKRAGELDVPGDMAAAQRNLELVLNLRANGVRRIAGDIGAALGQGRGATEALRKVAGQMQAFLASDVIFSQRVAPLMRESLDDAGLEGTRVPRSQFLPTIGWLDLQQAASKINPDAGGAGTQPTGEPAPGTHGHGLTSVSVGDTSLSPDAGADQNKVTVSPGMALKVKFQNQGENDEQNVKVNVKVTPTTGRAFSMSKTVAQTTAGSEAEASINFTSQPAKGSTAKITVTIAKVGGEQKTENNTNTYSVFFQ